MSDFSPLLDEYKAKKLSVSTQSNVVQANTLIERKPQMRTYELKLFLVLIASINYEDTELNDIKVPIKDVIDLLEANPKNAYTQIKRALVGLSKKQFQIETKDKDGVRTVEGAPYIAGYRFTEGSSIAYISVSPVFKPYLIDLKRDYTLYALRNALKLSHPNSIRTYELLAQYRKIGVRYFTVEEFKKKIGIPGKYAGNNSNLKKKVLEPVCREISEKTDIITRTILTGRGEDAKIEFLIIKKEDVAGPTGKLQRRIEDGDMQLLLDLLTTAIKMRDWFDDKEIKAIAEHALQITPDKADVGEAFKICSEALHSYIINHLKTDIKNPMAYYISILEELAETRFRKNS